MILVDSKIHEMGTRRTRLKHSPDVFLKARDMYKQYSEIRSEWISVTDENGKHLYYLHWRKNGDIQYINETLPADAMWDYDPMDVDLDLTLLMRADVFLFEQLDEYTYTIATIIRRELPDKFLFFLDKNASFFFEEGDCLHIINSIAEFYNRFYYFAKKSLMYITSQPLVVLNMNADDTFSKRYNAMEVMESIFWKTERLSFGELHPEKIFYLIRNPVSFEGLGDVIRYVANRIAMVKKKRGNIMPVVDIGTWGDGNQFDKNGGNIWTMFFRQPSRVPLEEVYQSKNVILAKMQQFVLNPYVREELVFMDWKVFMKYVSFKPEVLDRLQKGYGEIFREVAGERILGVVGRGSDYTSSKVAGVVRKPVAPEGFLDNIRSQMKEKDFDKLFLATEDQGIFDLFMESDLKDKILSVPQKRIDYNDERNKDKLLSDIYAEIEWDGYENTMDYLLVLFCLSKCNALVSTTNCGAFNCAVGLNGGKYEYAFYY